MLNRPGLTGADMPQRRDREGGGGEGGEGTDGELGERCAFLLLSPAVEGNLYVYSNAVL